MRELRTTAMGNVAKDITIHEYPDGGVTAIIRLAVTSRYYDQGSKDFTDRKTEFITVYARRALARHVGACVHKGDPLIVTGRLSTNEWEREDGNPGHSLVINAEAIGHDLTFGASEYTRSPRRRDEPDIDENTGEIISTTARSFVGTPAGGEDGGAGLVDPERDPALADVGAPF